MKIRGILRSTTLALGAATLIACQSPQMSSADRLPETSASRSLQEQRQGDVTHEKVVAQFGGKYNDPQLQAYVDEVGHRVAAVSEQPNERWTFTVLDSPAINAFAIPGGYVYVTRGLLALAENEAQLAGVLGHEIGHVTAGHSGERQTRSGIANLGLVLGAVGLSVLGVDPNLTRGALQIGQTAAGGIIASYSRNDELEADNLGVRYLARAGYDPYAQAKFLEDMGASSALQAKTQGKGYNSDSVDFLASHPATADRTRQAIEVARAEGAIGTGGDLRQDRYLRAIEGMVYGQSPGQGYVEGSTFRHPELGFAFSAPRGYTLQNTPAAVIGSGSGNTRLVFDGARDPGGSLETYIAQDWAGDISRQVRAGRVQSLERLTIDGLAAARGILPVEINNQPYDALLVAIRMGDRIYRFTGLAPRGSREIGDLAQAASSFRRLSPAEKREARAKRTDIVTVRSGDTAESLGRQMAVESYPVDTFRVLNGLQPGERLSPGQQVKLVR